MQLSDNYGPSTWERKVFEVWSDSVMDIAENHT